MSLEKFISSVPYIQNPLLRFLTIHDLTNLCLTCKTTRKLVTVEITTRIKRNYPFQLLIDDKCVDLRYEVSVKGNMTTIHADFLTSSVWDKFQIVTPFFTWTKRNYCSAMISNAWDWQENVGKVTYYNSETMKIDLHFVTSDEGNHEQNLDLFYYNFVWFNGIDVTFYASLHWLFRLKDIMLVFALHLATCFLTTMLEFEFVSTLMTEYLLFFVSLSFLNRNDQFIRHKSGKTLW